MMEDGPMRKVTLAVITVVVAAGAASIYAASNPSGERLIPGSGPITEQQIRDKLMAEGFSNIQITLRGGVFAPVCLSRVYGAARETRRTGNGRLLEADRSPARGHVRAGPGQRRREILGF